MTTICTSFNVFVVQVKPLVQNLNLYELHTNAYPLPDTWFGYFISLFFGYCLGLCEVIFYQSYLPMT